jgi:hypothetical protein
MMMKFEDTDSKQIEDGTRRKCEQKLLARHRGYSVNLFVRLFTVLRPAQEFFIYMETSPLPVRGCKI